MCQFGHMVPAGLSRLPVAYRLTLSLRVLPRVLREVRCLVYWVARWFVCCDVG